MTEYPTAQTSCRQDEVLPVPGEPCDPRGGPAASHGPATVSCHPAAGGDTCSVGPLRAALGVFRCCRRGGPDPRARDHDPPPTGLVVAQSAKSLDAGPAPSDVSTPRPAPGRSIPGRLSAALPVLQGRTAFRLRSTPAFRENLAAGAAPSSRGTRASRREPPLHFPGGVWDGRSGSVGCPPWTATSPALIAVAVPVTVPISWRTAGRSSAGLGDRPGRQQPYPSP
jgi:hypothetical protein